MASRFGIAESDLTPVPVATADWEALLDMVAETPGVDIDTVIEQAEDDLVGHMMGMPAEAANIALAKPFAVACTVWRLHLIKAQNAGYEIPDAVDKLYDRALKWADKVGRKLVESEGTGLPGVSGSTEYSVPDTYWGMDQTEDL